VIDRENRGARRLEPHNGRSGLGVTMRHTGPEGGRRQVTRDDWKRKPMPGKRRTIPLGRAFPAEELAVMRCGLVPQQMEDKWFIFYEDDALFFHRSWTGNCIYVVHFHDTGDEIRATYVDANRDPEQYGETDDQRDRELVLELINILLLQRPAPQE
jgi:hypothetical protein